MTDEQSISYEFDNFRLLPNERLLFRDGQAVQLTPKVFDTLLVFVSNSGRLLTKEELMKLIWPNTTVEEGNLTQNIFLLRKLFGERPHDHQYFVTIPSQGYRFVAKVRVKGTSSVAATSKSETGTSFESLAVLPFKFLGADRDEAYLGVGISDALITKLSTLRQIAVRPTTSVLKFSRPGQDPIAAGRELGVDAVLDGTVQRATDRIRLNIQLARVTNGETIWANNFDESFTDMFTVQDSIAKQVSNALALELGVEEKKQFARTYTANVEAQKLYIKGRYFWDQRTQEGMKRGIEYANAAAQVDPTFALAHVGVADSFALLGEYLYLSPHDAFPKSREAAEKALEVDKTNAEAHASLGEVSLFYEWNWSKAERHYQRSIALNPNYSTAYHWYAWFLMTRGRFSDAMLRIKQAQKLDPSSLTLNTVIGMPYYYQRMFDEAIEQFRQTLEMDKGFVQSHYYLGAALAQQEKYTEAIESLQRVVNTEFYQQTAALLIHAFAHGGFREKALAHLGQLNDVSQRQYVSPFVLAIAYVGMGDVDRGLDHLENAYEERAAWIPFLNIDPFLETIRSQPRFQELLTRLDSEQSLTS